jgi:site-specific DNA-methyltransferase (adenine-specific)
MSTQLHLDPTADLRRFQWFTPEWVAVELVERYFPDLTPADLVLEPSCGKGAFLKAIPDSVPAIGIEIDPGLVVEARANSERHVICGDFTQCHVPHGITNIIGNPPFEVATIERFLARSRSLLPELGRCGFLLPAYALQTHNSVWRWLESWSMQAEVIPRRVFPRLRLPLLFVLFTRSATRTMIGFALYKECVEFDRLSKAAQAVLIEGRPRKGVWRALVEEVLEACGGEASLSELYERIAPRRPTANAWWREKVRQQVQLCCTQVERGRWRLSEL